MLVKRQGAPTVAEAEEIAIEALGFLSTTGKLDRFLGITGLTLATLRDAAAQPGFLAGILEQLLIWEPWLLEFAAAAGIPPDRIVAAARSLAR